MSEKAGLIYKGFLVLLIVAFLAIFYQYSENGRYTFHKEIEDILNNKYVVDTRTATIYGTFNSVGGPGYFCKIDLRAGEIWFKPVKIVEKLPEEPQKSPSK